MISKISVLDSFDNRVKSIQFNSLETGLNQYITCKDYPTFETFNNGFKYEISDNLYIVEFIDEKIGDIYARY